AGVDRVFRIGGAQAIAALAYGTATVPRVDKIVGPGNGYVAAAKRLVFGDVGIDSIAGPTEVVIGADDSVDPAWIAADLLAQAELAVRNARALADRVTAAGALFLGAHTPEPVGDYIAGPSHVLPTSGNARFASPLGVADFVKRTSIIEYSAAALAAQADDI